VFLKISIVPRSALLLGFAGLIPFFGTAAVSIVPDMPLQHFSLRALLAYGAVILTFLGGIRWGLAMVSSGPANLFGPLFVSVVPALLAWFALLLPSSLGLILLALGFAGVLVADLRLSTAPTWYPILRLPLSAGAIIALSLGLFT